MKPLSPPPLEIVKRCPKSWAEMPGTDSRRFCGHCQLHVHNLSAMTPREREKFIKETGGRACIAYEMDGQGGVILPTRHARWLRPLRRLTQIAAAFTAAALPFLTFSCAPRRTLGSPVPPASGNQDVVEGKSLKSAGSGDISNQVVPGKPAMMVGAPLPPPLSEEKPR